MRVFGSSLYGAHSVIRSDAAVGAEATTIKTPVLVTKNDLLVYIDKLDPFVEAMDQDADEVDKQLEASLPDPKTDMSLFHKRDNFVKTWNGWLSEGSSESHPGYYYAWQAMKEQVRSGVITKIWPWLVFGPAAGFFMIPVIIAGEATGAERRAEQWNNIRDAHIRLGEIRNRLIELGRVPSGDILPETPGDVGLLGIGLLGDKKGQGSDSQAWYEKVPWGWVTVGVVLLAGAAFLSQVRGVINPFTAK